MPTNSGSFGVTKNNADPSGPAVTPVPDPMPITQEKTPFVNNSMAGGSGGSSSSGGKSTGSQVLGTVGSIGGSLIGGPIGGAVGGFLGDIFGDLFASGGPVGLAEGGRTPQFGNYFADSSPLQMGSYTPTQAYSNRMSHSYDWHPLSSITPLNSPAQNLSAAPQATATNATPMSAAPQSQPQGYATPLPPGALDPRDRNHPEHPHPGKHPQGMASQGTPQGTTPSATPNATAPNTQTSVNPNIYNVPTPQTPDVAPSNAPGTYYVPTSAQMGNGGYADGGAVIKGKTAKGNTKSMPQPKLDPMDAPDGSSNANHNNALATGYLVGAYHQKKFGGTPHTLANAAEEIKAMLSGGSSGGQPQGMAEGGKVGSQATEPPGRIMDQNAYNFATAIAASRLDLNDPDFDRKIEQLQRRVYGDYPKNTREQEHHFAQGGAAMNNNDTTPAVTPQNNADDQLAQQALLSALGLDDSQSNQQQEQKPQELAVGGSPMPQLPNGPPQGPPSGMPPQGMPSMPPPPMAGPPGGAPQGPPQGQPPLKQGQTFQGDGSVKGPGTPTSDSIPARLSNGEFVMSAAATQFLGVDKLNKLNEQGKQGFMQAMQGVQDNQPSSGAPNAAPMPPSAPPQGQPPMQQAKGGVVMKTKGSGFCGL